MIAAPVTIVGVFAEIHALEFVGKVLFWLFWVTAGIMCAVYITRSISGHYKGIEENDWGRQLW